MKYRNSNNVRLMRGLFYETAESPETAVYTLKDEDREGHPSLYQIYMSYPETTEYQFAIDNLDGWEHWQMLSESAWFKGYVTRWRQELELKLRSQSLAKIHEQAMKGGRDGFQANKFIVDGNWNKSSKGRPSKAEISRKAQEIAEDNAATADDWKRISK